ncbi:MAG: hypothetical protein V7677_13725, partial [Motiliproteus sp.]
MKTFFAIDGLWPWLFCSAVAHGVLVAELLQSPGTGEGNLAIATPRLSVSIRHEPRATSQVFAEMASQRVATPANLKPITTDIRAKQALSKEVVVSAVTTRNTKASLEVTRVQLVKADPAVSPLKTPAYRQPPQDSSAQKHTLDILTKAPGMVITSASKTVIEDKPIEPVAVAPTTTTTTTT